MGITYKFNDLKFGFIILATLISIRLWSFQLIDKRIYDYLDEVLLLAFAVILVIHINKVRKSKLVFSSNVMLLIALPFLGIFSALIYHEQPMSLSFISLRTAFFWLFYFVLHAYNIPPKKIIHFMIFVGCVWIFLTVVQQFTYPHYYFYTRDDSDDSSIYRAGVYRFMLNRHHYGVFVVVYFFYRFLITQKLKNLAFVFIGLLGFYFFGTRQFALAVLLCMCISIFYVKGMAKLNSLVFVTGGLVVLFVFKDVLLSEYIRMTSEQLESNDDIRMLCAQFYFYDYWPHWTAKIIGNGVPNSDSKYGIEANNIRDYFHFFKSDIGIIGAYNTFGILYVLNIFWLNIKGMKNKYYTRENKYLKLMFINALILIFISEYYFNSSAIPFYCFVLYLVDKAYEEKSLEEPDIA